MTVQAEPARITDLLQEVVNLRREKQELREQVARLEAVARENFATYRNTMHKLDDLTAVNADLQADLNDAMLLYRQEQERTANLTAEARELRADLDFARARLECCHADKAKLQRDLNDAMSLYRQARERAKALESVNDAQCTRLVDMEARNAKLEADLTRQNELWRADRNGLRLDGAGPAYTTVDRMGKVIHWHRVAEPPRSEPDSLDADGPDPMEHLSSADAPSAEDLQAAAIFAATWRGDGER